jgi:transcriptional regulator
MYQSPHSREDDLAIPHQLIRAHPWVVCNAPEDFFRAQMKGIIGVEIEIAAIEGKWKVSQNRPAADREGVAAGVGGTTGKTEILDLVKRYGRLEGNH